MTLPRLSRRRILNLAAAFACAPRHAFASTWQGRALGAEVSVTLTGPRTETEAALADLPAQLDEIENLFSLYRPNSALSRLNGAGFLAPNARFDALMDACDRAHTLTDGLFDPTVQPLWQALAQGRDPAPARALLGWPRVRRTAQGTCLDPGQQLTLNGIAQGFATDLIRASLAGRGFTHALIDIGEQAAIGGPFRLALEDPDHGPLGHLTLQNAARATSSPGALRFGANAHILGPQGQDPLWSTVSIEARDATTADALSTAAVFMDIPRLEKLRTDADLLRITLVDRDGNLRTL